MEPFADVIIKAQRNSRFDSFSRDFLPFNQIALLVTEERVRKELGENDLSDDLVTWVVTKAPRMFLATVSSHLLKPYPFHAMEYFHYYKFDDNKLKHDNLNPQDNSKEFHENIWEFRNLKSFSEAKWRVTAPVFEACEDEYGLPAQAILPFTRKGEKSEQGGFSRVFRVTIHPDHYTHSFAEVSARVARVEGITDKTLPYIRLLSRR